MAAHCPIVSTRIWVNPFSPAAATRWDVTALGDIISDMVHIYQSLQRKSYTERDLLRNRVPEYLAVLEARLFQLDEDRSEQGRSVVDPTGSVESFRVRTSADREYLDTWQELQDKLQQVQAADIHLPEDYSPYSVVEMALDLVFPFTGAMTVTAEEQPCIILASLQLAGASLEEMAEPYVTLAELIAVVAQEKDSLASGLDWQRVTVPALRACQRRLWQFLQHQVVFAPSVAAFVTYFSTCLPEKVTEQIEAHQHLPDFEDRLDFAVISYLMHPELYRYTPFDRASAALLFASHACEDSNSVCKKLRALEQFHLQEFGTL